MDPTEKSKTSLPAHLLRKCSVLAPADPRSIRKLLRGERLAPMTAERIRRALRELGLEDVSPATGHR
jgi:hypothetical protein